MCTWRRARAVKLWPRIENKTSYKVEWQTHDGRKARPLPNGNYISGSTCARRTAGHSKTLDKSHCKSIWKLFNLALLDPGQFVSLETAPFANALYRCAMAMDRAKNQSNDEYKLLNAINFKDGNASEAFLCEIGYHLPACDLRTVPGNANSKGVMYTTLNETSE